MKLFKVGSLILLLMSFVVAGCGKDSHVKQFYSSGEGKYKIFAVGIEEFDDTQLSNERYSNKIESVYIAASMEVVERDFEYLDIKDSPAFVVFNHKEIIYKTNKHEDLITFLEQELR